MPVETESDVTEEEVREYALLRRRIRRQILLELRDVVKSTFPPDWENDVEVVDVVRAWIKDRAEDRMES